MSGLAELERAKRRRLQEAYTDLRPMDRSSDHERQAKLRNLMLGAAADSGLQAGGNGSGDSSGSRQQSVRGLAAAAAASITGVESTIRNVTSSGSRSSSRRRWPDASGGAAINVARAPPPPPGLLDGGFLPESDPVQRLSQLPLPIGGSGGGSTAAGGAPGRGSAAAGAASPPSHLSRVHSRPDGHHAGAVGTVLPAAGAQFNAPTSDVDDADIAALPSDVELALISIKSDLQSHSGSVDLPPMALRSQLSCLLADRLTVERQLDEQRRANRVRVFKLPTGADEFGILTTADYRAVVRQAANNAVSDRRGGGPSAAPPSASSCGAYGGPASAASAADSSSRWHEAAEAFLSRVVDRCTDFELSRDHMIYLMQTTPHQPPESLQPTQPPQLRQVQQPQQQKQRLAPLCSGGHQAVQAASPHGRGGAASAASSRPADVSLEAAEEQVDLQVSLLPRTATELTP
ncbi:hypothetical protein Vretifemale_13424 [Volvox reticuliferus]|uniref:Uncharacterized protein n=1 Tax=Volvox reticuliferus TaxID=1737510 RepID=A0A8J4CK79_9CHLO|nr:hypothetical protein Vretifemale_13424 [Volvox reticuliferus]